MGFQPHTVPTNWSVGPWDDNDAGFFALCYQGGDLRAMDEPVRGRRVEQRDPRRRRAGG